MGNKSEGLPSGYTRLNYIENVGESYINSGYQYKADTNPTRVVVDFKFTNIDAAGRIFGGATSEGNYYAFALAASASEQKFTFTRIGATGRGIRFADVDTNRHLLEYIYREGVYFDGVLQESTIEAANATIGYCTPYPIGIFAMLRPTKPYQYGLARIYSLQFWDNTGLARNYVPAQRKSDGEIGMYETVTKSFFTNDGTGKFIGG